MSEPEKERAKLDFGDDEEIAVPKNPSSTPRRFVEFPLGSAFERPASRQHVSRWGREQPRHELSPVYQSEHVVKRAGCINFQHGLTGLRTKQSTNMQTARKSHSEKLLSEQ